MFDVLAQGREFADRRVHIAVKGGKDVLDVGWPLTRIAVHLANLPGKKFLPMEQFVHRGLLTIEQLRLQIEEQPVAVPSSMPCCSVWPP